MIGFIVRKFIGSKNEREVKKLRPLVARINGLEEELQKLPDEALREKTAAWKEELSKIEDKEELADRLILKCWTLAQTLELLCYIEKSWRGQRYFV